MNKDPFIMTRLSCQQKLLDIEISRLNQLNKFLNELVMFDADEAELDAIVDVADNIKQCAANIDKCRFSICCQIYNNDQ